MNDRTNTVRFGDMDFVGGDRRLDWEPLGPSYASAFRAYLCDTYAHCTYHRERFKRENLDPSQFSSLADFERYPLMSTTEVGLLPETHLLPDRYREAMRTGLATFSAQDRFVKKFSTTGSSGGGRKVTYFTQADWDVLAAEIVRSLQHLPEADLARVLNLFQPAHAAGRAFEDALHRMGASVELRHFANVSDEDVMAQMKVGMAELGGFTCLAAPPCLPPGLTIRKGGTLDALLTADVDNYIGEHIRVVITSGAPRDLPEFRLRERVWAANERAGKARTRFFEIYGAAEVGVIATECEQNSGLHLLQGQTYTEVVKERTRQSVSNGERGLVVITGLRGGSRFVRYVVGDEVTLMTNPCPCGRKTPRITNLVRVIEKERLRQGCAA